MRYINAIYWSFGYRATLAQAARTWKSLKVDKEKHNTFDFPERFRCFRLNKSVLETAETKQPDSQLHFAPKNIKIHLLVFENELIDATIPVPKKCQNRECVF